MKIAKKILFYALGILLIGIILSICFNINKESFAATRIYDYTQLDDSKYPGVKSLIQNLKNQYGDRFNFQIYETGINWSDALNMEFQGHDYSPKNLIEETSSRTGMWFCPICTEKKFDSGYNCASLDALAYMMDPRNSLNIDSVFQFKTLGVSDVTSSDISRVVQGTFLNTPSIINALTEASNNNQINGYYITSKIINEQGKNGSTLSNGQGYNGEYVGYYNLFNIGASGNGSANIIRNGLKRAQEEGWTSPEASILEGVSFVKESYIGRKQDTLYFQKFNVVSESGNLFNHQYQQNIMAAEMEGRTLKDFYTINGQLTGTHYFLVPVYENMPKETSARPDTEKENGLYYEVATVNVPSGRSLKVLSTPSVGIEISSLNNGERVKVLNRMTSPIDGIYWDLIVSERTGTYGYVARNSTSGENYLVLTGETGTTGKGEQISVADLVFDYKFYADKYSDLKQAFGENETLLRKHWLENGIKEGRQGSPVFDPVYYVEHSPDLKSAFGNDYRQAYEHFISGGYNEPRASSSEYCGNDYRNNYDDLANMSSLELMKHYLEFGRNEKRQAIGEKPIIFTGVQAVLFDTKYYADNNSDLKATYGYNDKALKKHWLECGIKEGRDASPIFNASYYLYNNDDLKEAYGNDYEGAYNHFLNIGYNELRPSSKYYYGKCYKENNADLKNMTALELMQHYMNCGRYENRISNNSLDLTPFDITNYLFDARTYADLNTDLKAAFGYNEQALKNHWLNIGIGEGRQASIAFDVKYYLENYKDLKDAFKSDYRAAYNHFINSGINEGRKSSLQFDVKYYLNNNQDLKNLYKSSYCNAFKHFVESGINENRITSSTFNLIVYRSSNKDLNDAYNKNYREYYIHYMVFGKNENRKAY